MDGPKQAERGALCCVAVRMVRFLSGEGRDKGLPSALCQRQSWIPSHASADE